MLVRELHPICVQYDMEAGGPLSTTITVTCPADESTASCDPIFLPIVSLHKDRSILSSLEPSKHSTNTMVTLCRERLNLTIAFFYLTSSCLSLSWCGRPSRGLPTQCAGRAIENLYYTRGIAPTNFPRVLRMARVHSFSLSS